MPKRDFFGIYLDIPPLSKIYSTSNFLIKNMQCNGACKSFKATSNTHVGGRYEQGQKRCNRCEIYINWEGLWCPCCGYLLRTKPRGTKLKRRLLLLKKEREET